MSALNKQVGGGHYSDMAIQPIEFITANNIPYREGNVLKYVCRHASKNGLEDIEKAIHYLEMIRDEYQEEGDGEWGDWVSIENVDQFSCSKECQISFEDGDVITYRNVSPMAKDTAWVIRPIKYRVKNSG